MKTTSEYKRDPGLFASLLPLFRLARQIRKWPFWLFFSLSGMIAYTFAAQLEILAIGIVTERADLQGGTNLIARAAGVLKTIFPLQDSILSLALLIIFAAVLKSLFLFLYRYSSKVIGIRVAEILRETYFRKLQELPCSYYLGKDKRHLSARILGDALLVADSVQSSLINYVQTPIMVATTLTFCFLTSWKLSILIFIGVPLVLLPIRLFSKRIRAIARKLQGNQERLASILTDFLGGLTTVKIFGMERFSEKRYAKFNTDLASFEEKNARYEYATRPFVHAIGMTFLATALVFGLYVLEMSRAEVIVYCGLIFLTYEPVKKFAEETTRIQRGIAASERLFEVIREPVSSENDPSKTPFPDNWKSLSFDKVGFRYENDYALKNVSFNVKKGEFVAIVGPTGSGKSTLASLVLQLFQPSEGTIQVDGKPLTTFRMDTFRKITAFVPQKPFLFIGTVKENIECGRRLNLDQLNQAVAKAHAEEFISQLPHKLDTVLEESGNNLSGGQQQRLAIARCLADNKDLLIFDEATSSLDPMSESAIRSTFQKLKGKITLLVIAHRLSSIQDADRIIYMEEGEVRAEGTKDELFQTCPPFKKMWETAFKEGILLDA